jgi:hypothetical protein
VVQDVPNLRAHVESRAQRLLWVLLAVVSVGAIWLVISGPRYFFAEPVRRAAMIHAAELFAEGLNGAAIFEIESEKLRNAPEGAFLRAVMRYYQATHEEQDELRTELEQAAEAEISGADTLLGYVLLAQDCGTCLKEAARWFDHALAARADREARLGLAAALTKTLRDVSVPRAHYDALLAEDVNDTVRLWALVLRGSMEVGKAVATAYTEEAAREGFSEAQFRLWKRYLAGVDPESRLWLAMAALQGHEAAIEQVESSPLPPMTDLAESRLQQMADDPRTAIGRAAQWCLGQSGQDAAWLRKCRLTGLEGHRSCILPSSVLKTLGLNDFESSAAYSQCRRDALSESREPSLR